MDFERIKQLSGDIKRENGASLATRAIHADADVDDHSAIAPALHTSTTYRFADDPNDLVAFKDLQPEEALGSHAYARYTSPNMVRFEAILTSILGGPALTYASGLAAFHAVLVLLNPGRIAIGEGYHGCHGVINMVSRMTGLEKLPLDCDAAELQPGDIVHVETPLNPTGEAINLQCYADKARKAGALLVVDATFGPPPLQKQMPNGYGAVFSITLKDAAVAKRLPSKLSLFQHATSLGGVESLIEWRAMTNTSIDQRLVRLSIGVEALEDLTRDLLQGLEALREEATKQASNRMKIATLCA